jgi:hypothetical protein
MASGDISGSERTVSPTAFRLPGHDDQRLVPGAEAHRSIDDHVRQGTILAVE